jgi:hypothetical protein
MKFVKKLKEISVAQHDHLDKQLPPVPYATGLDGRAIAQAVSRWLPTAEVRAQTRV